MCIGYGTADQEMKVSRHIVMTLELIGLTLLGYGLACSVIEDQTYWAICFASGMLFESALLISALMNSEEE